MKLLISIILILSTKTNAMIVIKSFSSKKALSVKAIFENKYKIPNSLIKIENAPCEFCENTVAACLCINKKGELKLLSFDMKTLKKSYRVFQSPIEGAR